MRVKEMYPLCCISLESSAIGDNSPELMTALSRSCSDLIPGPEPAVSPAYFTNGPTTVKGGDPDGLFYETASFFTLRFSGRRIFSQDCEQIMLSEFSEFQGQVRILCEERSNLLDTLRQLEAANIENEASGVPEGEYQLTQHAFSDLQRSKYSVRRNHLTMWRNKSLKTLQKTKKHTFSTQKITSPVS
ncbi:putative oxysterol-binding protein [Helianthus annuus]|nr:putative oxysterol-binding protein [Helianthus annuus]